MNSVTAITAAIAALAFIYGLAGNIPGALILGTIAAGVIIYSR